MFGEPNTVNTDGIVVSVCILFGAVIVFVVLLSCFACRMNYVFSAMLIVLYIAYAIWALCENYLADTDFMKGVKTLGG